MKIRKIQKLISFFPTNFLKSSAYLDELLDVMTINDDGVEAEGLEPLAVHLHVVLERGSLALA